MNYNIHTTKFSLFSGLQEPLLVGDILEYMKSVQQRIDTNTIIFGTDPDFEPTYDKDNSTGNSNLEMRRRLLEQSTIQFAVSELGDTGSKGHDLYSQFYSWLTSTHGFTANFLTSIQWKSRNTIINEFANQKLNLYSEIHNKDLRYNFNYQISNQLSQNVVRKAASDLFNEMVSVTGGITGQVNEIIKGLANIGDAGYDIAQRIQQQSGGTTDEGALESAVQFKNQILSTFKMKQHETVKLWGASSLTMTQKLKFIFRQTKPENLDMVYFPLLRLILMSTPFSYTLGVDSNKEESITDKSVLSGLTEMVPPVSLSYNFGNGLFLNEYCIISDLKYELYDYKYVDSRQSNVLPNKLINKVIPTVQEVEISLDSILPLVQYYRLLKEEGKTSNTTTPLPKSQIQTILT